MYRCNNTKDHINKLKCENSIIKEHFTPKTSPIIDHEESKAGVATSTMIALSVNDIAKCRAGKTLKALKWTETIIQV